MGKLSRRGFIAASAAAPVAVAGSLEALAASGKISTEDALAAAERVMGFDFFDDEERAMLAGGEDGNLFAGTIEEQLSLIQVVRANRFPNTAAPALTFNPRLKGHSYRTQDNSVTLHSGETPPFPADMEDVAFAPVAHLSHWLKSGQVSSMALTEMYLDRIARYAGRLECFVTVTADLARAQAAQADAEIAAGNWRGPLHGIPWAAKDLFDTDDILTTWGAATHKDRVAHGDAHIVTLLREAGAVLLGKTTLGALAQGDVWFGGVTRNPWNTLEGSSGSSAGSASATAAGLVGFAIGTETLGSIISPANRNGVAGLRPTFGRVGRSGAMALSWSLDKIGPLTRHVEDTALILAAINGEDMHDVSAHPWGFDYDGDMDLSQITLGYDPRIFEGDDANAVDIAALDAAKTLGCQMKEISLPDYDTQPLRLQIRAEAAAAFQELVLDNTDYLLVRQTVGGRPNSFRRMYFVSAVDAQQVDRLRRKLMQDMAAVFEECDAIIGSNYGRDMLWITNYTGHPQLSLRAGFEDRELNMRWGADEALKGTTDTLPRNVSLFGPLYEEGRLIAIGRALEAALNVVGKRPTLDEGP